MWFLLTSWETLKPWQRASALAASHDPLAPRALLFLPCIRSISVISSLSLLHTRSLPLASTLSLGTCIQPFHLLSAPSPFALPDPAAPRAPLSSSAFDSSFSYLPIHCFASIHHLWSSPYYQDSKSSRFTSNPSRLHPAQTYHTFQQHSHSIHLHLPFSHAHTLPLHHVTPALSSHPCVLETWSCVSGRIQSPHPQRSYSSP